MEPPSKRQRIVTGCLACRERHQKCDDNDGTCRQCQLNGLECVRQVNVRFRSSHSNSSATFPAGQKWFAPPLNAQFQDETSDVAQHYEAAVWEANAPAGTIIAFPSENGRRTRSNMAATASFGEPSSARAIVGSAMSDNLSPESYGNITSPAQESPRYHQPERSPFARPSPRQPITSPLTTESPASLKSASATAEGRPSQGIAISPFTEREAALMRNFIDNMALWADITDTERHFEIEVPRRALFNPILRYALFAFSSRHMNRFAAGDYVEALHYHDKCLELLIPIISERENELTDDILAAVAILRQDEEMEVNDNCFHLHGVTRILNQVSTFCSGGGLGEAAAWLCLRQDIYISLVTQKPLRTQLGNFEHSASLKKNDDMSWANKIVILLAKVLSIAFSDSNDGYDEDVKKLEEEVESWMVEKPPSFDPIQYIPRTKRSTHRFPVIWMLQPFHVMGCQYYHIAKIVLAISACRPDKTERYFFRWGRVVERRVRAHMLTVLGLAKSNPRAENTLFTARHCLSVWGGVLTRKLDQEAAKDFLEDMEKRTGWTMGKLLANLNEQWEGSDDD